MSEEQGGVDYGLQDEAASRFDFFVLVKIVLDNKWKIMLFVFVCSAASVYFAFRMPNVYSSFSVLVPVQKEASGGLGALAAQYGGLAAIAGVSLGKENGKPDQAVELAKSWAFWDAFLIKYPIKPDVYAAIGWDKLGQKIMYDPDMYDESERRWVRDSKDPMKSEPSSWEVFKVINRIVKVTADKKTGFITVSVEHFSPVFAKFLCEKIASEINLYFQSKDKVEAINSIEYLSKKIKETSIAEMQSVFYAMIESQTRSLMLAEVSDEYLLKTVISPMTAEEKIKPNRAIMIVLVFVVSCVFSVLYFVLANFFLKERSFSRFNR